MAIKRSPSSPPIDPKEKRVHFLSPAKKLKKSKGPSLPPDLVLGPSEAPIAKVGAEVRVSLDVERATSTDMGKVLGEREEGLVTIARARV